MLLLFQKTTNSWGSEMSNMKSKKEIKTEIDCLQLKLEILSRLYDVQLEEVNQTGGEMQDIKQQIKVKRVIMEKM